MGGRLASESVAGLGRNTQSVDAVYFNDRGLQDPIAINIRSSFANRLMTSSGWQRLRGSRSTSIESHIGPAIAVLFFNDYGFAQPLKCYLFPSCMERSHSIPSRVRKAGREWAVTLCCAHDTQPLRGVSTGDASALYRCGGGILARKLS